MYIYLEHSVSLISIIMSIVWETTAKWSHTSINKFYVSLSKPREACSQCFEHVCFAYDKSMLN